MEDEVTVTIDDIVVTLNKRTGVFIVGAPNGLTFSGTLGGAPQQRQYIDRTTGQATGQTMPDDVAFQVTTLDMFGRFIGGMAAIPGLRPATRRRLKASLTEFRRRRSPSRWASRSIASAAWCKPALRLRSGRLATSWGPP